LTFIKSRPYDLFWNQPWNHGEQITVSLHAQASEAARRLVVLAEMDPDTVTTSEMDASSLRVYCKRCVKDDHAFAFDWRHAVGHL
jgi:hypothetical protein